MSPFAAAAFTWMCIHILAYHALPHLGRQYEAIGQVIYPVLALLEKLLVVWGLLIVYGAAAP